MEVNDRAVGIATWVLFQTLLNALEVFAFSLPGHEYPSDLHRQYELIAHRAVNEARECKGYSQLIGFPGTPGVPGVHGSEE